MLERYFLLSLFSVRPQVKLFGPAQTMLEGDTLNLTCVIISVLPKPQVSWYKDEALLVDEKGTNLIVAEVSDNDEGLYKCEARDTGGVASGVVNVSIDGKAIEEIFSLFASAHLCRDSKKGVFLVNNLFCLFVVLGKRCSSALHGLKNIFILLNAVDTSHLIIYVCSCVYPRIIPIRPYSQSDPSLRVIF